MRSTWTKRAAMVGGVVALTAAGVAASIGTAGAAPTTETFEFTGAAEDFVVPAGVCSVTIDTFGAQGGNDFAIGEGESSVGGEGGRATATIPVTPGETLVVRVGGQGESVVEADATASADEPGDTPDVSVAAVSAGGFNGGGSTGDTSTPGGGGGGASDVRQGGDDLEHRVVVAGGGGGAGGDDNNPGEGDGGDGGGLEGLKGEDSVPFTPGFESIGGGGGTQTGPGAAGSNDPTAEVGSLGTGGTGGSGDGNDGGGGGGGGYFGGGGGGGDTGVDGDDGAGGGGGSGFGPAGTAFETGNQFGNGLVEITYDPAAGTCPAPAIVVEPTFTG